MVYIAILASAEVLKVFKFLIHVATRHSPTHFVPGRKCCHLGLRMERTVLDVKSIDEARSLLEEL